jgi:hypothetical protein
MKELLDYIVPMLMILILTVPLSFLHLKFMAYKNTNNKTVLKIVIITNISIILLFTIYKYLPKYETEIDINIRSAILAEININGDIYNINENIKIENISISRRSGFIAVKTKNTNKIVLYTNEKSIFRYNRKININIDDKNIKINSLFIKISFFGIENNENYDSVIELIRK